MLMLGELDLCLFANSSLARAGPKSLWRSNSTRHDCQMKPPSWDVARRGAASSKNSESSELKYVVIGSDVVLTEISNVL